MENVATSNKSEGIFTRILLKLSPGLAREKEKVDSIIYKSDIIIQEYSDLSDKIKQEVDRNHFSTLLNYEKRK